MPLKPFVKKLEELGDQQEALKGLYVEADGGFRLDVEGGFKTTSEIEGLTSALGKERTRADEAEKTLKAVPEDIRKDPKAAQEALKTVANLGDKDKELEERIKAAQEPLQKQVEALTKERDTERDARRSEAKRALFGQSKWVRENLAMDPTDAAEFFGQHVLFDDDGTMFAKDHSGNRIFDQEGKLATGDAMVEALVKSRYPDVKHPFYKQNQGGVAPDGRAPQSGKGEPNPWARDTWNSTEQHKITINDPQRAEQLRKAVGVR